MKCPYCQSNLLISPSHEDPSAICKKCGKLGISETLAYNLNLSVREVSKFGPPQPLTITEGDIPATHLGEVINVWRNGSALHPFPTIFPSSEIPDGVYLIHPSLVGKVENAFWLHGFSHSWLSLFKGKCVNVVYTKDTEPWKRNICLLLKNGSEVNEVLYENGELKQPIPFGQKLVTQLEDDMDIDRDSLAYVVEQHHYRVSKNNPGLPIYCQNVVLPPRVIINRVVNWFKRHGGEFLWDDENSQGYLFFKNKIYTLSKYDKDLLSMLLQEGGIVRPAVEASQIIEGLCHLKHESKIVRVQPWLRNTDTEIRIENEDRVIIIQPNKVFEEPVKGVPISKLERSWLQPIKLTENRDISFLFDKFAYYFSVPQIAKEIIISWFLSIFLKDCALTRPGIRLTGPPSSGKSTILQLLFQLLYGVEEGKIMRGLPASSSVVGLWRKASLEPLLLLDNENVKTISTELRTLLDVCATGGERVLGGTNSILETKTQRAHALVILSGLDSFIDGDVLTRYIEINVEPRYQTDYYGKEDLALLNRKRNDVLSGVFHFLADDVLPVLPQFLTRENLQRTKIWLDTKERIADYFLLMLCVGKALQDKGLIAEGDLLLRWGEYIREIAMKGKIHNSKVIEWIKNVKFALTFEDSILPWDFIIENKKRIGVTGTKEEILALFSWAGKQLHRQVPWKEAQAMILEAEEDKKALEEEGFRLGNGGEKYTLLWGGGV